MRARIVRPLSALVFALLIAVGFVVPAQAASGPAGDVFTMINQQRAANSLPALVSDPVLDAAAWQWANYLASTGTFAHSTSAWRNAMISGGGWVNSGENIAAGYLNASSVMTAWMGSAGHRANILNSSYTGVGVAYVQGGPYGHYWVQIFAVSAAPRVPAGSTPTIVGTTAVGQTLTASTSGWPGGTSIGWTWAANGVTIPGATSSTYVPTISDAGRKLTATATGWLPGYYATSKTSNATTSVTGGATSDRIYGADRFTTAVEISRDGFSPGVAVAYVASGVNFPDALGAAPAASLLGGPLLLTQPTGLPAVVVTELGRLNPGRIVVVGGPSAVSESVLAQLNTIAPTTRASGDDRFATSRAIVSDAFDSASVAYIATGLNFPDALTASAAAASIAAPVVLVNGASGSVDSATVSLLRDLGVTSVRIAGSTGAISAGIESTLRTAGFTVQRLAGADRYETANSINAQAFSSASVVYLASAMTFPDALAGAALAGSKGAPLYLSASGCIPSAVSKSITTLGATTVVLLGGPASLSASVASFQRC